MNRLRWGILGTGNIARQFAGGVNASRRGALAAVGSRGMATAEAFAEAYSIERRYDEYDALIADREVDAVYVSLPNSMHHEWTIKALRAGKHVLCEKPFAISAAESEEMFDVAAEQGRVLVEAFMHRSHPLTHAYMNAIREGAIGEVKIIRASFCYRTEKIDGNVRFDPRLAGGALMDVGCYCINFARMVAGEEPESIHAAARLHERGVDEITTGTLMFPGGIIATFVCGMSAQADNTASICGTGGYIEVPVPWKPPVAQAAWTLARGTPPRMDNPGKAPPEHQPRVTHRVDAGMALYGLEADDFAATVQDGAPPRVSRSDTIGNMRVLDEMRRRIQSTG